MVLHVPASDLLQSLSTKSAPHHDHSPLRLFLSKCLNLMLPSVLGYTQSHRPIHRIDLQLNLVTLVSNLQSMPSSRMPAASLLTLQAFESLCDGDLQSSSSLRTPREPVDVLSVFVDILNFFEPLRLSSHSDPLPFVCLLMTHNKLLAITSTSVFLSHVLPRSLVPLSLRLCSRWRSQRLLNYAVPSQTSSLSFSLCLSLPV